MMTSAVLTNIQDTSPLLGVGGAAGAGASAPKTIAGNTAQTTASSVPPTVNKFFSFIVGSSLQSVFTGFAGTDTNHLLEIEHEDFAVADLVGPRCFCNSFDDTIEHFLVDRDVDFHFRQKVDHVLR